MSTENYDALFNPNVEVKEQTSKNAEEYNPTADKGQGGVYKAIIRFVPWWQDPTYGSIKEKWSCWLEDPVTQRGRSIDCPSSVGKPSILQDMYWKLKKSENVALQKKADIFSRRHTFASLIQVLQDKQQPELEGKILVYKYGVKIWEKINAELKPLIGEKHDPFDIVNGKAFALVITKVSGYNNYDQSKFLSGDKERIPLCIPNAEGKLVPINAKSDKKEVFSWVKTNSPDLNKYGFQEWDNDTHDYVNHVITAVTGQGVKSQNIADIKNKDKGTTSFGQQSHQNEGITIQDINIEDSQQFPDISMPDLDIDHGINGSLDDVLSGL